MSTYRETRSLQTLVALRQQDVDRLNIELTEQQAVRERYQRSLRQLDTICQNADASGHTSPLLALNSANYKQTVQMIAKVHRDDLALHEADMALSRRALVEASRKRETLNQVLVRRNKDIARTKSVIDQKHQDEIATQVWLRRSA